MASTTFNLGIAEQSLKDEGLYSLSDVDVGGRIADMERKEFPFLTEIGLEFCQNLIQDAVSKMS